MDQNVLPEEGVFVDFFRVKACAGSAFVRIAQEAGAAVIPGLRYGLKPRGGTSCDSIHLSSSPETFRPTHRYCTRLERVVREYPDQWLWIHRRWKTRSAGEGRSTSGLIGASISSPRLARR